MLRAWTLPALLVTTVVHFAACGGNVVVDPARTGSAISSSSGHGGSGAGSTIDVAPSSTGPGGFGGFGTTVTDATVSSTVVTTTVVSSVSSTGTGFSCPVGQPPSGACAPGPACAGFQSPCLAEATPVGQPFTLRVAHLTIDAPKALAGGIVGNVFAGAVEPSDPACGLQGTGTFSWLIQIYPSAEIITGASLPVQSPGAPYSFVQTSVVEGGHTFQITPAKAMIPTANCDVTSGAVDVVLPIYTDTSGTSAVLLPLHQLVYFKGSYSGDGACIGTFNSQGLQPSNGCNPGAGTPLYNDGARAQAYFDLLETDAVLVPQLGQSLCVVLTGSSDGGTPAHCKKSSGGGVAFQGDWCSSTNSPATPTCADALQFNVGFAASAVAFQ